MLSSRSSDLSMPLATDRPPGLPRLVPAPAVAVADSYHSHIHAHSHGIAAVDLVVLGHSGSHRVAVRPAVHHSCFGFQNCHLHLHHHRYYYCRYRNTSHRQRNRHAHPLVLLPKTLDGAFCRLHVAVAIFDRAAHLVLAFYAAAASSMIPTQKEIFYEMAGPRLLLLMLLLPSQRRGPQVQAM